MITLASMFRDSGAYIDRYFAQVAALREHHDIRLVLAEGDSTDDTYANLKDRIGDNDTLIKVDHGDREYGSVDHPVRWANIATVARAIVNEVTDPGDAFIWVESDLLWEPASMLQLLSVPVIVAPMVIHDTTNRFYDYWGFRKDGQLFDQYPPYYPPTSPPPLEPNRLVKIDSCGSCFVADRSDWEIVTEWDGMWPFTASGQLWLDPTVTIRHPW